MKQISESLKSRILGLMAEADYMEITSCDWKAIGHNVSFRAPENMITDEMIQSEIDFYYNA